MSRSKIKIYFSEEDLQDMTETFNKEEGLWNTWTGISEEGKEIDIELYLGQEEEELKGVIPLSEVKALLHNFYDDFCKGTGNEVERDAWIRNKLQL